jgi:hypothetical protein
MPDNRVTDSRREGSTTVAIRKLVRLAVLGVAVITLIRWLRQDSRVRDRQQDELALDDQLADTFPASDPVNSY